MCLFNVFLYFVLLWAIKFSLANSKNREACNNGFNPRDKSAEAASENKIKTKKLAALDKKNSLDNARDNLREILTNTSFKIHERRSQAAY